MNKQKNKKIDINPQETQDWIESIKAIINIEGIDRAKFILNRLISYANRKDIKITPLLSGGGQENGLRAGTLPTALSVGFGHGVELAEKERIKNMRKIKNLKRIFLNKIKKSNIKFILNGKNSVDNNINITFPEVDGDFLFSKLDNISISSGSACGSGSGEPSYVLKELGVNTKYAKSTLRIGISKNNTEHEMLYFASKISKILKKNG